MRFDLIDLRLFLHAVEEGSLTRGAQAMNLALASASARISGMEAALGTRLLDRTRRGVRPTAAGDALVRHARRILFQVEQMRGELRAYGTGLKGRIRLLSNTAALGGQLPAQLCRFLADHPDLSIDLDERPSVEIAPALAEGRADLGIAADVADLTALQTRLLTHDRLVVIASRRHPLAEKDSVSFSDLLEEPFVGVADAALESHLADRAARLGRQLQYRIRLRAPQDVAMLVDAGVGIAILSESAVAALRAAALVARPLQEAWTRRQLYLCARDFRALASHVDLLAQRLLAASAVS